MDEETSDNSKQERETWPDGSARLICDLKVVDGVEVRHGEFKSFHENGSRARQGVYEDGKQVGAWKSWDEGGRILFEGLPDESPLAEEPDADAWDEPVIDEAKREASNKRTSQWIELAVVLALGWLPFMAAAVASEAMMLRPEFWQSETVENDVLLTMVELPALASSLQVFLVLLFIISRSDMTWRECFVVCPRLISLLPIALFLAVLSVGINAALFQLMNPQGPLGTTYLPSAFPGWLLLVTALVANSLAEEFVWRGYVLARLRQLTGSVGIALVVSSLLFASYHLYQGPLNASIIVTTGLIFGASVLLLKRIWPAVVAHTFHNLFLYTPYAEQLYS